MRLADRRKAERLEAIMAKHKSHELRTLSDLRQAGFRFSTVDQAWKRLAAQRTLHGFTQEQIDVAVRLVSQSEKRLERE